MIEFFNFVIEVLFWIAVFWFALQIFGGMFNRHVSNKIEEIDAEIKAIHKVYKRVKIEEHHGHYYLFDLETDQFIVQGRDAEDVASRLPAPMTLNIIAGDDDVRSRFRATIIDPEEIAEAKQA